MSRYEKAKEFILDKLKSGLPETLYYHGYHHIIILHQMDTHIINILIDGRKYLIHEHFIKRCKYFNTLNQEQIKNHELIFNYPDYVVNICLEILYPQLMITCKFILICYKAIGYLFLKFYE